MFNLTDDRKYKIAAIGAGLSQLAAGQPVNIAGSQAGQMVQQRQMRSRLEESGLMERFSPEQRAVLAQMEPSAAMRVIAGDAFKAPPKPMQGKVVGDRLVNPVTGQVIGDYRTPTVNDAVRVVTGEDAARFGLDPKKAYEVTENPDGTLKNVSGIGGGDTNVNVDLANNLTPGREAVDKAFADTYIKWTTGGGADAANQAAQIGSVLEQLEAGEALTGPSVGLIPEFARALVNPEAKDAQDRVESVVQRSLKETLGAQFTEREGTRLIERAYNPVLSPEYNAARLRGLFRQLESAAVAKQAMVDHFAENGTLMGYAGPSMPSISDFEAAIDAVPVPEGEVQIDGNGLPDFVNMSDEQLDAWIKSNGG